MTGLPAAGAEQAHRARQVQRHATVAGFGDVELVGELDWEPAADPVYLRRLDDGKVCRARGGRDAVTVNRRP